MTRFTKFPELRVKIKDLAQEAASIRREELIQRSAGQFDKASQLHLHRINRVRPAARSTLLAYGYVRGRKYSQIENPDKTTTSLDLQEIARLVRTYGGQDHASCATTTINRWQLGVPLPVQTAA